MYELSCRYDSRKSFYGKAVVSIKEMDDWREIELHSYNTLVAKIIQFYENNHIKNTKYIYYGKYSQTTTRHQKEFFRQYDLSDKQIKELFKNGTLIIDKELN